MTMRITVLGTSYEGLTISVGLAKLGHQVTTVDTDPRRARKLQRGITAGGDLDLSAQLKIVLREGLLRFTSEPEASLAEAEIVIIAAISGTEGNPNRSAVLRTAECLSGAIASFSTVLVTAGVPTGSCRILQDWLNNSLHTGTVNVVACPLFFEEPNGLQSFLEPDRIVLGYEKEASRRVVDEVFARLLVNYPPVFHVSWEAAEMMRSSETIVATELPKPGCVLSNATEPSPEPAYSRAGRNR